jgi:hypothetical protein
VACNVDKPEAVPREKPQSFPAQITGGQMAESPADA